MPNDDIDYSNTIFYKIYCKDAAVKDIYVGHTTNFVQRKCMHKNVCNKEKYSNHNLKLYSYIRNNGGWNNWRMDIIGFHECHNQYEAKKIEQNYFETLHATLNSIEPFPKSKPKPKPEPKSSQIVKDENSIGNLHAKNSLKSYFCEKCSYKTCNLKDYKKHLSTSKHKRMILDDDLSQKQYICQCGRQYKYSSGLSKHKTKCEYVSHTNVDREEFKKVNEQIIELLLKEKLEIKKETLNIKKDNLEMKEMIIDLHKKTESTYEVEGGIGQDVDKGVLNISDIVSDDKYNIQDR